MWCLQLNIALNYMLYVYVTNRQLHHCGLCRTEYLSTNGWRPGVVFRLERRGSGMAEIELCYWFSAAFVLFENISLHCCLRVHMIGLKSISRIYFLSTRCSKPWNCQDKSRCLNLASKSLSPKGFPGFRQQRWISVSLHLSPSLDHPICISSSDVSQGIGRGLRMAFHIHVRVCIYIWSSRVNLTIVYLQLVSSNREHMNIICTFTHKICKSKLFNALERKFKLRSLVSH